MGMSASQARFLGLTARKNNVEYEGQQINQQRTSLANTSANYYNDLLGMSVPIPPAVDNFTKTVYTFEDGALTNSITAMIAQPNGKYTVSFLRSYTDDFSPVSAATSILTNNGDGTFNVGAAKLRKLGETPDAATIANDNYLKTLTDEQIEKLVEEEQYYVTLMDQKYGDNSDWLVRYVENTTSGKMVPSFYKKSDAENAVYGANSSSQSHINCYTIGSAQKTEEVKAIPECALEKDSSGRYINITLPELDASGQPIKDSSGNVQYGATYAMTTNTLTDQDKYNDAMNQYEFKKAEYDQAVQNVNAKISIIQSQDKNLELRMKQLDTEQKAISTEMDAVQKVIEKNVESTFKTFG